MRHCAASRNVMPYGERAWHRTGRAGIKSARQGRNKALLSQAVAIKSGAAQDRFRPGAQLTCSKGIRPETRASKACVRQSGRAGRQPPGAQSPVDAKAREAHDWLSRRASYAGIPLVLRHSPTASRVALAPDEFSTPSRSGSPYDMAGLPSPSPIRR